jgi:hypothetical protein
MIKMKSCTGGHLCKGDDATRRPGGSSRVVRSEAGSKRGSIRGNGEEMKVWAFLDLSLTGLGRGDLLI